MLVGIWSSKVRKQLGRFQRNSFGDVALGELTLIR